MVLLVYQRHATSLKLVFLFCKVIKAPVHLVIYLFCAFTRNIDVKSPLHFPVFFSHSPGKIFLIRIGLNYFLYCFSGILNRFFPYILCKTYNGKDCQYGCCDKSHKRFKL